MVKRANNSYLPNRIQSFFKNLMSSSEVRDATAEAFLKGKVSQEVVQSEQQSTLNEGGPLTSNTTPQSLGQFTVGIDSSEDVDAKDLSSDRVKVNKKLKGFKKGLGVGLLVGVASTFTGGGIFLGAGASLSLVVCLMPPSFLLGFCRGFYSGYESVKAVSKADSNREFFSTLPRSSQNVGNDS